MNRGDRREDIFFDEETLQAMRRGWRFGAEDFLERSGKHLPSARSEQCAPEQVRDQERLSAISVFAEELKREGLKASELPELRKGHQAKVRITRSYHYDQVGSTIALTNGTGAVTGRADYSPYGTLQAGSSGEPVNANATP